MDRTGGSVTFSAAMHPFLEPIVQTHPHAAYLAQKEEIDAAIARVLDSGRYLLGPETEAFEQEFAGWVGTRECVTAASGTEALHLALRACGVGEGDEVITVSHTAVATVAAIELCGAKPVLVDIERDSFNLQPTALEGARTERTRAVVPVHLYGQAADLAPIRAFCEGHGLWLIEDCSQAHGARYEGQAAGTFGHAAAFSFYPTKNLGALGDGGAVVTNDPARADTLRALRQYGWRERRYVSEEAGWNGRMDELQAAVLRVKLRTLDADNDRRRALALRYDEALAGIGGIAEPRELPGRRHVWHQYVVRCADGTRDAVANALRAAGIHTLVHYPVPVHRQPAYAARGLAAGDMTETEAAAREVLSLPIYPQLPTVSVDRVATVLRGLAKQQNESG